VRRPREFSLRSRLLWLSVIVVSLGLVAGGVLLIGVLNFALLRAVNAEASDTASGVVKLIDQHSLAEVIQVNPSMQVQVIDGDKVTQTVDGQAQPPRPPVGPPSVSLSPVLGPHAARKNPRRTSRFMAPPPSATIVPSPPLAVAPFLRAPASNLRCRHRDSEAAGAYMQLPPLPQVIPMGQSPSPQHSWQPPVAEHL